MDYEDLWHDLYEWCIKSGHKDVAEFMTEMDPRLVMFDEDAD